MLLAAGGLAAALVLFVSSQAGARKPYPPGPKPSFIFGNAFDFPLESTYLVYAEWAKRWGRVIHMSSFGRHTVILNDAKACHDLLEKRGAIYASRPDFHFGEMMGMQAKDVVVFMPYGDRIRKARKVLSWALEPRMVRTYWPSMQEGSTRFFLERMLTRPTMWEQEIQLVIASLMQKVTYGIKVDSANDAVIPMAKRINDAASDAMFGSFWIDHLPILKWVPTSLLFPNTRKAVMNMLEFRRIVPRQDLFEKVKEEQASGEGAPCFTSRLLESKGDITGTDDEEELMQAAASALFGAAYDTTVTSMLFFILYMLKNPEVQVKAQEELGRVIGSSRLPTLEDRQSLPYVDAVLKEVLRLSSVTPMAVPHKLEKDDVYEGMFLPKGSTVLANAWLIMRDPKMYPDHESFRPERFLVEDPPEDPRNFAFGFGRRVCPGRDVAVSMLFQFMASTLHVYDIRHSTDAEGKIIPVNPTISGTLVRRPSSFEATLVPRSPAAEALIRSAAAAELPNETI